MLGGCPTRPGIQPSGCRRLDAQRIPGVCHRPVVNDARHDPTCQRLHGTNPPLNALPYSLLLIRSVSMAHRMQQARIMPVFGMRARIIRGGNSRNNITGGRVHMVGHALQDSFYRLVWRDHGLSPRSIAILASETCFKKFAYHIHVVSLLFFLQRVCKIMFSYIYDTYLQFDH